MCQCSCLFPIKNHVTFIIISKLFLTTSIEHHVGYKNLTLDDSDFLQLGIGSNFLLQRGSETKLQQGFGYRNLTPTFEESRRILKHLKQKTRLIEESWRHLCRRSRQETFPLLGIKVVPLVRCPSTAVGIFPPMVLPKSWPFYCAILVISIHVSHTHRARAIPPKLGIFSHKCDEGLFFWNAVFIDESLLHDFRV